VKIAGEGQSEKNRIAGDLLTVQIVLRK